MSTGTPSYPFLFEVKGMVAVVTGGGTGIGLMIAEALAEGQCTVYIVGRRLEVLKKAAERNLHGKIIPLQCDVTSRDDLLAIVETVRNTHGYLDLLVNNAGISLGARTSTEPRSDIRDLQKELWECGTPQDFAKTFDVNVSSVYFTTVAFLELLHEGNVRRGVASNPHALTSQVITVSSVAALRRDERQFSVSYALSKSAVTHLAKMFVGILKDFKIRSNIIAPGFYPSEMSAGLLSEESVKAGVPLQRAGMAEDMAGLILFLASKAGAYVNGTVHITDGGRLSLFPSTY